LQEVAALARKIAGADADPKLKELAQQIAETQVDFKPHTQSAQ
jgi:hypothetical protein